MIIVKRLDAIGYLIKRLMVYSISPPLPMPGLLYADYFNGLYSLLHE